MKKNLGWMAFTLLATLVVPYLVTLVLFDQRDPTIFLFLSPSIMFVAPLYLLVFLVHLFCERSLIPVSLLTTGTVIYLAVAFSTLNNELYGAVIGKIYFPSLIILYAIGIWVILSDSSKLPKISNAIGDDKYQENSNANKP
jgi:hypothetical protein